MNGASVALELRLADVRERIAAAERRSGRSPGSAVLVGVVKTLPAETVARVVALGLRDLGENRVQEAELHQEFVPRDAARWHMIGHLQKNKAGKALGHFDLIHGVDGLELAEVLARRASSAGAVARVLVEVNVSGEASKFGAEPDALPALLERMEGLPGFEVVGLMTIGEPVERAEAARPTFERLRGLRDDAERRMGRRFPELSMGMSADFEVAVEEGSTLVRVGTALFGERGMSPVRA